MQTIIQKILVEEHHSFACRYYKTPNFETSWHKHEEVEIINITEGFGTVLIGDYIGEYKEGDVFFISSNLPHWFRKSNQNIIGNAIVAQFRKTVFGEEFLATPELRNINNLLNKNEGLKIEKKSKTLIAKKLLELEQAKGYTRYGILLDILNQISLSKQYSTLSKNFSSGIKNINPVMEDIIEYSFKNYLSQIKLSDVADMASMSIPTFCRFFKKNIKKTYFEFIQELRINHACKLLKEENKTIMDICYESGYNSWAHFSKQFKQVTKRTPSSYRKEFAEEQNL